MEFQVAKILRLRKHGFDKLINLRQICNINNNFKTHPKVHVHACRASIRDIDARYANLLIAACRVLIASNLNTARSAMQRISALPTCGSLAENVGVALQYAQQLGYVLNWQHVYGFMCRADEFTAVCGIMQVIAVFILQLHAMPYRFIYFTSSRG